MIIAKNVMNSASRAIVSLLENGTRRDGTGERVVNANVRRLLVVLSAVAKAVGVSKKANDPKLGDLLTANAVQAISQMIDAAGTLDAVLDDDFVPGTKEESEIEIVVDAS